MERSKFFLASRGIVGGLVPLVFGALILFGYQIEPGMQTEAIGLGNEFLDMLVQVADGVRIKFSRAAIQGIVEPSEDKAGE